MLFGNPEGANRRAMTHRVHNSQDVRVVTLTRDYATDPADLWNALTDPDRIARWFLPVTGELKPGGRYQLKGNASGLIEKCEPPTVLHLTWEFGEQISWVVARVEANGDLATLKLEHMMPKDAASQEHWRQYGPGATGVGWELSLLALGIHFSTDGKAIDAADFEAWTTSDDGKTFVKHCAQQWGEAHIASGADSSEARTTAARTGAFYSGE
ncbi:MAG: SRPBCC family protein [Gammaproteobacteria bacterium]